MVEVHVMTRDSHVANTLDLLTAVFENYPGRDFAIRLWDGTIWEPQKRKYGSLHHRAQWAIGAAPHVLPAD